MRKKKIALKVGCDTVPCLYAKYAKPIFVQGVGDLVNEAEFSEEVLNSSVLIVYPQIFSSSIDAYKLFKIQEYNFSEQIDCNFIDYNFLQKCTNDLTKPAVELFPKIGSLLDFLNEYTDNNTIVRMSGSGSVCFVLSENEALLVDIGRKIAAKHPDYFISINKFIRQNSLD